ncbi:MAG: diguanylate cyclase (GGDEF)-like protein [Cycloclasticus sp.]|jgi:diguanylate cyclase (GGDEF)-like protein
MKSDVILIVDDDPAIRLLMKHALSDNQFKIFEAESAEQAIELFKQHSPDLTLLDVTMDGMDGFECCAELRKLPCTQQKAIVMVTALDHPEDIEKAFECGATDFMTKPLKWALFNHRVRYILKANQNLVELKSNQDKLAKAQTIARIGSWEWDFETSFAECSDELYRLLGLDPQSTSINYEVLSPLIHPADVEHFKSTVIPAVKNKTGYEIEYRINRGEDVVYIHDKAEVLNGRLSGIMHDISSRKKSEQEVAYYAYYDTLTELPNRRLFINQLESAISTAKRREERMSLLFIDLDRFKQVNDSYGHHVGDELLCQAADRIKECVRMSDVIGVAKNADSSDENKVARLAGDEFTVILCEVNAVENVAIIAQRLINRFKEPFDIDGNQAQISVSIGVAFYPDDGIDVDTLLQHADAAMYHAKEQGRNNYQLFSAEMNKFLQDQLKIEMDLKQALSDGDQLVLHFQPQINTNTQLITGFEALVRWQHPTKGLLFPLEFIGLAETSGLIVEMGQWILTEACCQAKKWQDAHGKNYQMAVNLSALQFNKDCLPSQIEQAISVSGLDPKLLELEITETAIIHDVSEAIPLLFELKKLGIKLAIDDFGTGYSSLSYLKNFPIDTLKIDKSFIDEIVNNVKDAAIAHTIVQLASNLGLSTVAEGVEYLEQQVVLQEMGCGQIQGYLFSKPMSPASIEETFFKELSRD